MLIHLLPVLVIGAVVLVGVDRILGTTYKSPSRQLIHVIGYAGWGALLFAASHGYM